MAFDEDRRLCEIIEHIGEDRVSGMVNTNGTGSHWVDQKGGDFGGNGRHVTVMTPRAHMVRVPRMLRSGWRDDGGCRRLASRSRYVARDEVSA